MLQLVKYLWLSVVLSLKNPFLEDNSTLSFDIIKYTYYENMINKSIKNVQGFRL